MSGVGIHVAAYFDPRDEWPYVLIAMGDTDQPDPQIETHMTTDQARQLALQILACATAAEQDSFLTEFLSKGAGKSQAEAALFVAELGKYRQHLQDQQNG